MSREMDRIKYRKVRPHKEATESKAHIVYRRYTSNTSESKRHLVAARILPACLSSRYDQTSSMGSLPQLHRLRVEAKSPRRLREEVLRYVDEVVRSDAIDLGYALRHAWSYR